jgi:hypothetical protein
MPAPPTAATHRNHPIALALALCCLLGPTLAQPRLPAPAASRATPPSPAASTDGLSDAVARCEARPDGPEKRACRRALAQQAPGRV